MTDVPEGSIEVPGAVALMAAYGGALFVANQLQYWCARIHADTFDDPRHGSAVRAEEKLRDGIKGTFGQVKDMLAGRVPADFHSDLTLAVEVRNYVAHLLPWDTRGLTDTEANLEALASRLNMWIGWFGAMCRRAEEHYRGLLRSQGVADDAIDAGFAPWHELGDPDPLVDLTPDAHLQVVRAQWARWGPIGSVLFETDTGDVFTFADNGLALNRYGGNPTLTPWHEGTPHLPATMTTRPTKKSGDYRGSYDYDLRLSTGVLVRVEPARGGAGFSAEVVAMKSKRGAPPAKAPT